MSAKRALVPQSHEPSPEGLRPGIDLSRMNAFGRSVSLEYYDISPETLNEVTEEDFQLVEVASFFNAIYTSGGDFKVDGLSFNEDEYTAMVRSPRYFGRSIIAKTYSARGQDTSPERRADAAERSAVHGFESKEKKMTLMLVGLGREKEWLEKLYKEMKAPKYAHHTEGEVRTLVTSVWQLSFMNMLDVMSAKNNWDDSTHQRAEKAMTKRLLLGPQRDKVKYWQDLTRLAIRYNKNKHSIIGSHLGQVRKELEKK